MAEQDFPQARFEIGKDGVGSIVVGYDGSPPATHAAAWAAGLARRERALLLIVYVEATNTPAHWTAMSSAAANEAGAEFVSEVRAQAQVYLSPRGVDWEVLAGQGEPAAVLEAVAEGRRADCIVVGRSRHRGGLLGSVPRSLLAHAARPIVVVP